MCRITISVIKRKIVVHEKEKYRDTVEKDHGNLRVKGYEKSHHFLYKSSAKRKGIFLEIISLRLGGFLQKIEIKRKK